MIIINTLTFQYNWRIELDIGIQKQNSTSLFSLLL